MNASRNEHTIASSCQLRGRGYWTGHPVHVDISAAPIGTGVQLIRSDLPEQPACPALVSFRNEAALRTNLQCGEARFQMVEHLMAALSALEIDNCYVEIDGEEFPGLDGSSQPYVEALQHCGLIVQARLRQRLVLGKTIRVADGNRWIEAKPSIDGRTVFEYRLSFDDDTPIHSQDFRFHCTPSRFVREVAPARTFVTLQQAKALRSQGIASHVKNRDLLVFGDSGPIDNELRFDNECARHKTLDLLGDLALAGLDLAAHVTSFRGGHKLNGQLAKRLFHLAARHRQSASGTMSRKAA